MDMGMTVLAGMDPKVISFFLSFFVDIIPTEFVGYRESLQCLEREKGADFCGNLTV
jgi:hypothetical protein